MGDTRKVERGKTIQHSYNEQCPLALHKTHTRLTLEHTPLGLEQCAREKEKLREGERYRERETQREKDRERAQENE
jgi:hypothetical protein